MRSTAAPGAAALLIPLVLAGGCATTVADSGATPVTFSDVSTGYLSDTAMTRLVQTAPPAPRPGSRVDLEDKAVSERFRSLENGDRWLLAASHAELRPPLALQHFDCVLDVRLASGQTPDLNRLMARVFHDAASASERVKARAARPRPVGDDPDRPACQVLGPGDRASASYPSGSAAVGAAYGEVFALLAPDRAEQARRMGHEIGVSRLVCAMHYPSDVAEGEAIGRRVVAEARQRPDFVADLASARIELDHERRAGRTNPGCAAERAALAAPLP